MTSVAAHDSAVQAERSSQRADALADRLEQGARALASFAAALTETEWQTRLPKDGRKVGVVVHHVALMYPLEIYLAQVLGEGKPIEVTGDLVNEINAKHAEEFDGVTKEQALEPPPQQHGGRGGDPRLER